MEELLKEIMKDDCWTNYIVENLTVKQLKRLNKIKENR